ncbi:MFS transporter [Rhodococcus opacus]|uniref:MFS transporter n=1 Tax=Rhodococcus opacus TaxID=37919 RepID=UPI00294A5D4F|nr:MFS transporter [Rhodococcus opacus]MDV6247215.1 MFS transporter [Rhodococcus opacus]
MTIIDDLRQAPMSRFQIRAVIICLVLVLMDGYDVAVMAFAAPTLADAWQIGDVALGYLLSASLFGMAAGSILLTPLADRIGRRRLAILSVAITTVGMVATPFSWDVESLFVARSIAGFGLGGLVANLNVVVAEMSSDKRRGLSMALYTAGFAVGSTLCGFLARIILPASGWESVFILGAALTAVMLVVTWLWLPESLEFLLTKQPAGALEKINRILHSVNQPVMSELPEVPRTSTEQGVTREVLGGIQALRTIALWLGYGFLIAGFYFANTWIPKLITTITGDPSLGVTIGTLANFGGILGCVLFGVLTAHVGLYNLAIGTLVGGAASFAIFSVVAGTAAAAIFVAILLGMLTLSGIAAYYLIGAEVYTAKARATGMGWMVGFGRLVSIVSPIVVGYVLAAKVAPSTVFALFALPMLASTVCVIAVFFIVDRNRSESRNSAPAIA